MDPSKGKIKFQFPLFLVYFCFHSSLLLRKAVPTVFVYLSLFVFVFSSTRSRTLCICICFCIFILFVFHLRQAHTLVCIAFVFSLYLYLCLYFIWVTHPLAHLRNSLSPPYLYLFSPQLPCTKHSCACICISQWLWYKMGLLCIYSWYWYSWWNNFCYLGGAFKVVIFKKN